VVDCSRDLKSIVDLDPLDIVPDFVAKNVVLSPLRLTLRTRRVCPSGNTIGGTVDKSVSQFWRDFSVSGACMLRRAAHPNPVYGEARSQELLNSKLEDTCHLDKAMSKP
jgi:hypothetical protein